MPVESDALEFTDAINGFNLGVPINRDGKVIRGHDALSARVDGHLKDDGRILTS